MLTPVEEVLKILTLSGDWDNFIKSYQEYEKASGGKIPVEKLFEIFIEGERGGTLNSLMDAVFKGTEYAEPLDKDDPKSKIIWHLSSELRHAKIEALISLPRRISTTDAVEASQINHLLKTTLANIRDKEAKEKLATQLFFFCFNEWKDAPVADNDAATKLMKEREKTLLLLLNEGTAIPLPAGEIKSDPFLDFTIKHDMLAVLKHPTTKNRISKLNEEAVTTALVQCTEDFKTEAFEGIASSVVEFKIPFSELIRSINIRYQQNYSANQKQQLIKMWGAILEYGIVRSTNNAKQRWFLDLSLNPINEPIYLEFIDPETNEPYELMKFIHDNPALKAGWEKPILAAQKSKKTLEELAFVMASLETTEARNEAGIKAAQGDPSSQIKHGEYTYNLQDIQQFMQKNPKAATAILKELAPGNDAETKEKRVHKLQMLAMKLHKERLDSQIATLAKTNNTAELRRLFQEDPEQFTQKRMDKAFWQALENGNKEAMHFLLKKGANINNKEDDNTPLIWAVAEGQDDLVRFLLDNKADVNMKGKLGTTALLEATRKGEEKKEIVELLVKSGANLYVRNHKGETPLMVAIRALQPQGTAYNPFLLLDNGAGLNIPDNDGITPLMVAIQKDFMLLAHQLIKQGADINAKNNHSESVMFFIEGSNNLIWLIECGINLKDKIYEDSYASAPKDKYGHTIFTMHQYLKPADELSGTKIPHVYFNYMMLITIPYIR